jgi:hypothetical protein
MLGVKVATAPQPGDARLFLTAWKTSLFKDAMNYNPMQLHSIPVWTQLQKATNEVQNAEQKTFWKEWTSSATDTMS